MINLGCDLQYHLLYRRHKRRRISAPPRTIFQRAIDACSMPWDDPHLRSLLAGETPTILRGHHSSSYYNEHGQPLWHGGYSVRLDVCTVADLFVFMIIYDYNI